MLDPKNIFPIGIGSWGIGGFAEKDPKNDDKNQVDALTYMFNHGMNLISSTWWYSEGHAAKLISKGIKQSKKERKQIFISTTVYPYKNPKLSDAERELDQVLSNFDTKYLDTVVFSLSSLPIWGKKQTINLLHKLLVKNIARFVGVTNFDLPTLKEFKSEFGNKLFSHEVTFSFEIRENYDLGIIPFASENNINNIIFQPLRRNRTYKQNWPLLVKLSNKYGKTVNQILLNWIVSQGYYPLVKSTSANHINENLNSLKFKIEKSDLKKLNSHRPNDWHEGKIDWFKTGDGIFIAQLPNMFDEEYGKQEK